MNWKATDLDAIQKRVRGVSVQGGRGQRARDRAAGQAILAGQEEADAILTGKRKYGNQPVTDDEGLRHDSKKEAKRWKELRLLLKAGKIAWLARQVHFGLPGATTYVADFAYATAVYRDSDHPASQLVVEDVKSPQTRKTQAYRIKFRQMKAIHGIEIEEI